MTRGSSHTVVDEILENCHVIDDKVGNIPLIVVKAKFGYISSSYLDITIADRVGDIAAIVRNAKTMDELLKGKIDNVTTWAEDLGLRPGMSVKRAIKILKGEERIG